MSQENDAAIDAFKKHPKIKFIIEHNDSAQNELSFHSMPINRMCGVIGCYWSTLVVMKNNSIGVNPRSDVSNSALVSRVAVGKEVEVELVELKLEKIE